ncbi:rhomboid family protein [Lutispora thermophila]|uniref:Membrane associated serine protease, rhomboid family n=1 Tax=Lutispora thermophila DSM 19022 TaxID=1122184 RepID=A0A1M6B022_9FIRM|nr:rhomboid family intramembrane serine protease [Lutispora thermophila]SHI42041.1 Membrane associated serine protease, rhomboid family [Lutispora thermophila DSM 19022]
MEDMEYSEENRNYAIYEKPPKAIFTTWLIVINVAVYIIVSVYSIIKNINFNEALHIFGAKVNLDIMSGQYWRFITPIFLHASIMHLLVNCYSLYWVGNITEILYGNGKFLIIYLLSGVFGNVVSFMFSPNAGVGASGSIFGLLGALLYFAVEYPRLFRDYFGRNIIITILINIVYGFSQSGIDNFAHLGGLLGGFLAAGIVKLRGTSSHRSKRSVFIILTFVILISSLVYGFNNSQNLSVLKIEELDRLMSKGSYKEADALGKEILSLAPKDDYIRLRTLWSLVIATASQNKYDEAFDYSEEIIKLDEARGHYLKGLLYIDTGNIDEGKEELIKAKSLDPDLVEAVDKLLDQL